MENLQELVKCEACGGHAFTVEVFGMYTQASLRRCVDDLFIGLAFNPGGCESATREAWNGSPRPDTDWLVSDLHLQNIDSTIKCEDCLEELDPYQERFIVPFKTWRYDHQERNEVFLQELEDKWDRELSVSDFGGDAGSPLGTTGSCESTEDGTVSCPVCGQPNLYLVGQVFEVEEEYGRAFGAYDSFSDLSSQEFKEQLTERLGDSPTTYWWEADEFRWVFREQCTETVWWSHTGPSHYGAGDVYVDLIGGDSEMGPWAGVGCTSKGCWEARGLAKYGDVPAAILASASLASAMRSLNDMEPLDLAAIAKDLEADDAKLAELTDRAKTWINSASNDARACGVAKEMLAPLDC
jgi:Zn finger protein HypA/HybF involved in hydrogenase expression